MTQGEIIINDNGTLTVNPVHGEIWLSQWQLADIFGVFVTKINSNIKAILKSEILWEGDVCKVQQRILTPPAIQQKRPIIIQWGNTILN